MHTFPVRWGTFSGMGSQQFPETLCGRAYGLREVAGYSGTESRVYASYKISKSHVSSDVARIRLVSDIRRENSIARSTRHRAAS